MQGITVASWRWIRIPQLSIKDENRNGWKVVELDSATALLALILICLEMWPHHIAMAIPVFFVAVVNWIPLVIRWGPTSILVLAWSLPAPSFSKIRDKMSLPQIPSSAYALCPPPESPFISPLPSDSPATLPSLAPPTSSDFHHLSPFIIHHLHEVKNCALKNADNSL